jgi:cyclophilin family peptidyl-prolyl cis-trans isomerase
MLEFKTSKGSFTVQLFDKQAPISVENFLKYADEGFFDGTIFHRVIAGFMVQGGTVLPNMTSKPCATKVQNEADNGLKNTRGTLAMARTSDPHSASCQFFINVVDNKFLDHTAKTPQGWGYAVFGKVVEGMEVADAIAKVKTATKAGAADVPVEAIVIKKATLLPAAQ